MRRIAMLCLCCTTTVFSQTTVDADHANIRYTGRVDFSNSKRPRFDWPGVQIAARFTGTSVSVILDRNGSQLNVYIDGDSVQHIQSGSGLQTYTVAQGLTDTEHDLLIVKRNEGPAVTFGGLVLASGKQLVAPASRPSYRIEYIGDSYTACYGCVSRVTSCPDLGTATNAYYSYAAVSARSAGAEYSLVAASGRGLLHNSGDPSLVSSDNMQNMFNRALLGSSTPAWDSAGWVPQLVVIALGINDLRDEIVPVSQETFTQHYRAFIARIQRSYPGSSVLCLAFNWPETFASFVRNAYDTEFASGNTRVHYLHVTGGNAGGCDFHPNVGGHAGFAQQVTPVVQSILGTTGVGAAVRQTPVRTNAKQPSNRVLIMSGRNAPRARSFDIRGRSVSPAKQHKPGILIAHPADQ